ncbi:MFS transporter [Chloroflexota bacterium]
MRKKPLKSKARARIFYGWWIVLAGALVNFYTAGAFTYGFTAFFVPIVDDFGWSYAALSLAFSLRGVEIGIAAPVIGLLGDRLGPRKIMLSGVLISGLGAILLSQVNSLATFYVVYIVLALGIGACFPQVPMIAVASWFKKKIGKTTGLLMIGGGGPAVLWCPW